jgi:hypothetical protein
LVPTCVDLSFSGGKVTDEQLGDLKVLDQLHELTFYSDNVTDAGLENIDGLKHSRVWT